MSDRYDSTFEYNGELRNVDAESYERLHHQRCPRGWTPAMTAQYANYNSMSQDVNAARANYNSAAISHGGTATNIPLTLPDVSNVRREGHAALINPAEVGANINLDCARRRHRFLDDHTYGYQTLEGRVRHEGFARNSYQMAGAFKGRLDLHRRESREPETAFTPFQIPSHSSSRLGPPRTSIFDSTLDRPAFSTSRYPPSASRSSALSSFSETPSISLGGQPAPLRNMSAIRPLYESRFFSLGRISSRFDDTSFRRYRSPSRSRTSVFDDSALTGYDDTSRRSPPRGRSSSAYPSEYRSRYRSYDY